MIFIGYSFGGLIVKQASILAPKKLCVKGFIFLGTPHLGSELSRLGSFLTYLGHWEGASTKTLEVTFPNSQENIRLHESFVERYDEVETVNFYEEVLERMGPFDLSTVSFYY
jgi:pimeloyl-ACP methyl ester carboxylesterase